MKKTLRQFHSRHMDAVTQKATFIVIGDGRSNYANPESRILEEIRDRCRRLIWLNPEAEIVEPLSLLIVAVCTLAREDPMAPAAHIAAGGLFRQFDALIAAVDPLRADTDPETARRWERDKAVLNVADRARKARLAAAMRHYGI